MAAANSGSVGRGKPFDLGGRVAREGVVRPEPQCISPDSRRPAQVEALLPRN